MPVVVKGHLDRRFLAAAVVVRARLEKPQQQLRSVVAAAQVLPAQLPALQ
jgi:hypothetical protein